MRFWCALIVQLENYGVIFLELALFLCLYTLSNRSVGNNLYMPACILVSCKPPTGQCLSHRDKDDGASQFHPYKTFFCAIRYEFNGSVSVRAVSWNVASDKQHCDCRCLLAFTADTEVWLWLSTFLLFIYRHMPHQGLVGTRSLTDRNTKGFLLSSCLSPCFLFSYYLFNDVLRLNRFSAE